MTNPFTLEGSACRTYFDGSQGLAV